MRIVDIYHPALTPTPVPRPSAARLSAPHLRTDDGAVTRALLRIRTQRDLGSGPASMFQSSI